jgi:hypothetical protein
VLQRPVRDQLVDGGDAASVEDLVEVVLDDDLRRLAIHVEGYPCHDRKTAPAGSVRIA